MLSEELKMKGQFLIPLRRMRFLGNFCFHCYLNTSYYRKLKLTCNIFISCIAIVLRYFSSWKSDFLVHTWFPFLKPTVIYVALQFCFNTILFHFRPTTLTFILSTAKHRLKQVCNFSGVAMYKNLNLYIKLKPQNNGLERGVINQKKRGWFKLRTTESDYERI